MESKPLSLKIGVSGVRGIVGESLTPQLITSFCAAFGSYSGSGPIVIGTDTRPSREMVKQAAVAGLLSVGCTPVDVGIVPIPSLMLRVRELDALGGVCISASHHPIEWNALKFIGPGGIVLRPNQAAELTDLYHQGVFPRVGAQDIAEPKTDSAALLHHREAIFRVIEVNAIRKRRFRVAVDCCNGAASIATPDFLRELGCEVVELNTNPDEPFPHGPEPVPENIGALGEIVRGSKADVGFAQDADADRVAIVNERGEAIGEDCTVALGIYHWLRRHPGPVVVNVSTSRMVDDIASSHGCEVHRTRVGEINVVEAMLRTGSEIGGEGNGGIVLSRVHPCRDSFVGMALILEALALEGTTVSELRSRIPTYAMLTEKLICPARDIVPSLRLLRKLYHEETLDLTDGVKVLWPDRWLHARPSTTEPVIRLHAEAPTRPEARELLQGALECLSPTL